MQMPRRIVDMRSRPSFLHPFFGGKANTAEFEVVRWLNKRVGAKNVDHFAKCQSVAAFIEDMDNASISTAVMVA